MPVTLGLYAVIDLAINEPSIIYLSIECVSTPHDSVASGIN